MTTPQRADESPITPEQAELNFRRWWVAMETSHAMLMAGLRDRVGPDGDVQAAYREWQEKHRAEKLRAYERAAERYRIWQQTQTTEKRNPDAS